MSAVSKVCLSATDWGLIKFASKVFVVQVPLRSTFNLILPDTFLRAYNQRPFARGVGQKKKSQPLRGFLLYKRKWRALHSDCLESPAAPGVPPRAAGLAPTPQAGWLRALRQHTPARDWPAPLSFSADTSGQPLAPSLLPPPSPRAWQEKRATWSGNKGPRGPRRSGTRCHSTPGPGHRCGLGPAPRPHAPGPAWEVSPRSPDPGKPAH